MCLAKVLPGPGMATTKTKAKPWVPPFCPNPNCFYHNNSNGPWSYKKIGFFRRHTPPHCIQRFACKTCGRSFSTQTFSTTYWQKRPDLDSQIIMKTAGGMANRQIARDLEVAPETINRHIARLGRHCMLFHNRMMRRSPPVSEIVVDGFESFELSQYFPIHHHIAVEKGSDFFIYFTDSELRRKGRMTEHQKRRRRELEQKFGRPDPKAIEKDMRQTLEVVLGNQPLATVYSDDHPAYKRSIRQLAARIDHRVTPGSAHRDKNNSLWEVNLLDLLIRHGNANHRRETLAWSKRRQSSAERLAVLLVWRNYMKGRREKVRGSPTPAMERGIMDQPLKIEELLSKRLFRTRSELPPRWSEYYDRCVETRGLLNNRRHELKMAF
jgi:transposase-like protein